MCRDPAASGQAWARLCGLAARYGVIPGRRGRGDGQRKDLNFTTPWSSSGAACARRKHPLADRASPPRRISSENSAHGVRMPEAVDPTIVIGAGVAGLTTALYLQRARETVVVIDPLPPAGGASFGNAGLISADTSVPIALLAWCARFQAG